MPVLPSRTQVEQPIPIVAPMAPPVPLDAALIGPFRSNTEREGGLALGQTLSKTNPFQPNLQWFLHVISTCPTGPSNLNMIFQKTCLEA